jgi:NTP pyrophosphatase (non-canonical NTP hydrolase)
MITSETYVENVLRSESPVTDALTDRISSNENIRLLHAGMGMCTEVGEFVDMMKKAIFYGKPLDKVNLREELGDICWYLGLAIDCLDTTLDEVMTINIDKLKARYPEKFTEYHAENRDLETERKILEG